MMQGPGEIEIQIVELPKR